MALKFYFLYRYYNVFIKEILQILLTNLYYYKCIIQLNILYVCESVFKYRYIQHHVTYYILYYTK